jgi:hypothetical protein
MLAACWNHGLLCCQEHLPVVSPRGLGFSQHTKTFQEQVECSKKDQVEAASLLGPRLTSDVAYHPR